MRGQQPSTWVKSFGQIGINQANWYLKQAINAKMFKCAKRIGAGAFSACQKLKLFEKSGKILLIPKTAVEYIQTQIFKIQIQTMFNFSTEAASSASDRCLMMDERKWASFCTHSASY